MRSVPLAAVTTLALVPTLLFAQIAPAEAPAEAPKAMTVPEKQAQKHGVVGCRETVASVSEVMLRGARSHHALSTFNEQAADSHAMHSLVIAERGGEREVFSLFAAPTPAGSCDSGFVAVRYYDSSCPATREQLGTEYRYYGDLGSNATYVRGDSEYLTLMPASRGCVAIRYETLF
ncbi:hypothetical protein ED208_16445 [Stagnimonas aquatica]|uniref:Uncharacterized protein n=1 Tax=Stagnimonas aquatica TaxID=2689987 RepID=A0A3N0V0H1_9GAMM|nr:hypothetical protein [Stagnimonas aquatica]ROH86011.1 hypothetical protein ED208_16445 [Stagnimonas aquatica]